MATQQLPPKKKTKSRKREKKNTDKNPQLTKGQRETLARSQAHAEKSQNNLAKSLLNQ